MIISVAELWTGGEGDLLPDVLETRFFAAPSRTDNAEMPRFFQLRPYGVLVRDVEFQLHDVAGFVPVFDCVGHKPVFLKKIHLIL